MQPQAVNFKVMRLSRPSFDQQVGIPWDGDELPGAVLFRRGSFGFGRPNLDLEEETAPLSDMLVIPYSFGTIYIGETFSSYISAVNISSNVILNVYLKVEMQLPSQQRIVIGERSDPGPLGPGKTLDLIVQHLLVDLGNHVLICTCNYCDPDGRPHEPPLRMSFKAFQVMNPLGISTRVRQFNEKLFVETVLVNTTQNPMIIDSVRLEPTTSFTLNLLSDPFSTIESADKATLKPNQQRQFVHEVHPLAEIPSPNVQSSISVGRLQITWRSRFGDTGRLPPLPIVYKIPRGPEVEGSLLSVPPNIQVEVPFVVQVKLTNRTQLSLLARVDVVTSDSYSVQTCGLTNQLVGPIPVDSATVLPLSLVALSQGVHSIPPLCLIASDGSATYTVDDIGHVLVHAARSDSDSDLGPDAAVPVLPLPIVT